MAFRLTDRKSIWVGLYLCIFAGLVLFFSSDKSAASPGECALAFLNQPMGAYSASLGQAGFAVIDGPEAIYGNPSLLGNKTALFACHQKLFLDTRAESFALTIPFGRHYSLGAAAYIFEPGKIDGYSADNIKTGDIASGDRLVRLAISRSGAVSYGLSVSYYNQRLSDRVGGGLGLGAGVAAETRYGRLAATCDNLGPDFIISGNSTPLPSRYALSARVPLMLEEIGFNFDLVYGRERNLSASAGLEYQLSHGFSLRAGGNSVNHWALGLGLLSGPVILDYSYLPLSTFGDRHLISIRIAK